MVASFAWDETNTSSTTVHAGITNGNWGAVDANELDVTVEANKIVVGANSFSKYIKGHFSGSYGLVGPNGLLWLSAGGTPEANTAIKAVMTTTYATPVVTSTGDSDIPTSSGTGLTVNFGATAAAATTTSCTAIPCYTAYYRSQFQTSAGAATGTQGPFTITLQYDES